MYLSEAIRIGAAIKPQTFGAYSDNVGTCALGAMWDAFRTQPAVVQNRLFNEAFMFAEQEMTLKENCPACGLNRKFPNNQHNLIPHLNDYHKWSREAIADWLETMEVKYGIRPMVASEPESCDVPMTNKDLAHAMV